LKIHPQNKKKQILVPPGTDSSLGFENDDREKIKVGDSSHRGARAAES